MEAPKNATQFQFSTDAFPLRNRLTAWREVFGRTVCNLDIAPLDAEGFHSEATVCQLPGLGVLFASSSPVHLSHTRELIKDDDLSFMAAPTCNWTASQLGRTTECGPGDGVLMNNAEVGSMKLAAASRFTTFRLPRAAIEPLVRDLDTAVARVIPAASIALRLLVGYLATTIDTEALVAPELQALVAAHVYDLLGVALGATRDATQLAMGRGVRAARLHATKTYVLNNLGSHELSAAGVASHLGVSPRYVHMLFETEEGSFTEFVLARRLARAHRMLTDPRFAALTISAIALDAGFADLSHFNRSFRRRFGCTPSDVRDAARRAGRDATDSTDVKRPI